tara:strand:- start:1050 stop:1229 length:180 start_codon:yes stop_codon:yes gene_type:complete
MENCEEFFYYPEELSVRAQFHLAENLGYKNPYEMNKEKAIKKIIVVVCDKKKLLKEVLN